MSGLDDLVESVSGSAGGGLGDILGGLAGGGSSSGSGLGEILGGILGGSGSTGGVSSGSGGMGNLLTGLLPMLGGLLASGGVQKILAGMQSDGLSAQADSWLGPGENQPVTGADVRRMLGAGEISRIAQRLGVSDAEAADAVAQVLPAIVDKVSPEGKLQSGTELESAFSALEHLGEG